MLLADFGVSKIVQEDTTVQLHSQVGTFMYMSPEIRFNMSYSFEADFWAMGAMLHEIITGKFLMNEREAVVVSNGLDPLTASFVRQLTIADRERRLGFGSDGAAQLRAHGYFEGLDFDELLHSETGPLSEMVQSSMKTLTHLLGRGRPSSASSHDTASDATADVTSARAGGVPDAGYVQQHPSCKSCSGRSAQARRTRWSTTQLVNLCPFRKSRSGWVLTSAMTMLPR